MASSSNEEKECLTQVTEQAQRRLDDALNCISYILIRLAFGIPKSSLWAFFMAAISYYLYDGNLYGSSSFVFSLNAVLAIISLLCISHNLKEDGFKKFMFLDELTDRQLSFLKEYIKACNVSNAQIF